MAFLQALLLLSVASISASNISPGFDFNYQNLKDDVYEQHVNLMGPKTPHEKEEVKTKADVDSWAPYDFSKFDAYLNNYKDTAAEQNRIKRSPKSRRRGGRSGRRRANRQRSTTNPPSDDEAIKYIDSHLIRQSLRRDVDSWLKNLEQGEHPNTHSKNSSTTEPVEHHEWGDLPTRRKKKKHSTVDKTTYELYQPEDKDFEANFVEMPKDLYQAHLRPGVIFRIHMSEAILKMQYRNYGEDKDESVIEADVEYLRLTRKVINDEITKFEDLKWLMNWFNNRSELIQEHTCNTRYFAVGTPPTMFTHSEEYMKRMCLFDNVYIDHIPYVIGEDSSLMAAVAPPVLHCDAATCTSVPFIDSVMFDERLSRSNVRSITPCQASCRAHCRNRVDCLQRCSERCRRLD